MSIYVYGIAEAANPSLPEKGDGIGDPPRPVRILREGDLAAIVSDAPEDLRPERRDLLAQQHVLAQAGSSGPVLPMRFGSLAPDDSEVTAALADRATLRDLETGTEEVVSNHPASAGIDVVSAGGRDVVFHSAADDIVPDDTNGKSDVFLRRCY